MPKVTPADVIDSALAFSFPAVLGKKVTAAFDGGRLTSDGGALLLSMAERAMRICDALAACMANRRAVKDLPDLRHHAENLIKMHKGQMASDRTSCRSASANQMRLILHTAAYWLLWTIRQAMPEGAKLAKAEFGTIRLRLLKVGARIIESASRIRIAFASACPDADLFRQIAIRLRAAPA